MPDVIDKQPNTENIGISPTYSLNISGRDANSPDIISEEVVTVTNSIGIKNKLVDVSIWWEEPWRIHHGETIAIITRNTGRINRKYILSFLTYEKIAKIATNIVAIMIINIGKNDSDIVIKSKFLSPET